MLAFATQLQLICLALGATAPTLDYRSFILLVLAGARYICSNVEIICFILSASAIGRGGAKPVKVALLPRGRGVGNFGVVP